MAFLGLVFSLLVTLTGYDYVPTSSRIYEDLDLLKTAGLISNLPSSSRPWTRRECFDLLCVAESVKGERQLNPAQEAALRRLRWELGKKSDQAGQRKPVFAVPLPAGGVGFDLFSWTELQRTRQLFTLGGVLASQPGERFFFYERAEFILFNPETSRICDSTGWHVPGFRWVTMRDRLMLDIERAYLGWQLPWLRLELGRDEFFWGPGYLSSVMLSDNAPALDQVQVVVSGRGGKFIAWTAMPSRWNGEHRFISAQRLELALARRLLIGGAMFNVYSWERTQDFSGLLNPLLPVFGTMAGTGHNDNLLLGSDIVCYLPWTKVYGQILVDNFEFNNWQVAPNCVGFQAGVFFAPGLPVEFRTEYALVTAFTYYHRIYSIMFENYAVPLGHEIGPDADKLWARVSFTPVSWLKASVWGDLTRRGYFNRGDFLRKSFQMEDTVFLRHYYEFPARGRDYATGAVIEEVEQAVRFGPQLEFSPFAGFYLVAQGAVVFYRNKNGERGKNGNEGEFLFRVEYRY